MNKCLSWCLDLIHLFISLFIHFKNCVSVREHDHAKNLYLANISLLPQYVDMFCFIPFFPLQPRQRDIFSIYRAMWSLVLYVFSCYHARLSNALCLYQTFKKVFVKHIPKDGIALSQTLHSFPLGFRRQSILFD